MVSANSFGIARSWARNGNKMSDTLRCVNHEMDIPRFENRHPRMWRIARIPPRKCRMTTLPPSLYLPSDARRHEGECIVLRLVELGWLRLAALAALAVLAAGCAPDYSPNTYASNAVQQANKVEPAVVVGFRQVEISASGTVGAVTGGAAGGVLGAQVPGSSISTALGTVGGALVGSLAGTGIEHAAADTTGWEYIVRKPNGELLSVTQREPTPIPLGQKVLVITGNQARIIPDYSTPPPEAEKSAEKKPEAEKKAEGEKGPAVAAPAAPPATGNPTPLTPPPAASSEQPSSPAGPEATPPAQIGETPAEGAKAATPVSAPPTGNATDDKPPP
jgi:outer membrane lipoprotein SlyB